MENGYRLGLHNQTILDLEQQLKKMRAHVESQLEMNKDLLCVKMRLEAEINNYQQLMSGNVNRWEWQDAVSKKKRCHTHVFLCNRRHDFFSVSAVSLLPGHKLVFCAHV